tara:strand:+ start:1798 stop:2166 length:369 start_codon:yes stop_codon:yes gene_type:complete
VAHIPLRKQSVNLVIDQGCNFERVFEAANTTGSSVTIATYANSRSATAKMRKHQDSSSAAATFTTALTGANCAISLTNSQTGTISAGRYIYSVDFSHTSGEGTETIERLSEGIVTVIAQATG